ncbi:MAG: hypothetical protein R3C19_24060 [Planctomycetaceae bacterium]
MGDNLRLRLPTLEVWAHESGAAFSHSGRSLTVAETRIARFVFQQSIDLEPVRIVRAAIAAAPTTLGNNIRIQDDMSNRVLVHELTHVWQYQNMGTSSISNSVCHQVAATFSSGSRNAAYNPTVVAGQAFRDYSAEHQAVIVERWYADAAYRANADYQALVDEVRRARPLPQNVRRRLILEEAAFGSGMGNQNLLAPSQQQYFLRGPNVPLLRIEF